MEILRKTSKNGKVFRIVSDSPFYPIYTIEYLKVYNFDNGDTCDVWLAATNPPNKVFGSLDDAKITFNRLLLEN